MEKAPPKAPASKGAFCIQCKAAALSQIYVPREAHVKALRRSSCEHRLHTQLIPSPGDGGRRHPPLCSSRPAPARRSRNSPRSPAPTVTAPHDDDAFHPPSPPVPGTLLQSHCHGRQVPPYIQLLRAPLAAMSNAPSARCSGPRRSAQKPGSCRPGRGCAPQLGGQGMAN